MGFTEKELKNEIWKPVVGFKYYEISNLGRVKSLPRNNTHGRIIKLYTSKANGYVYAGLSEDNKSKTVRVHKLVMDAFNPCTKKKYGYDKNWTIDHKDGDKTNNRLENLDWCSQSENQKRAYANGLNPVESIPVIDLDTLEIFGSFTDAAKSLGNGQGELVRRNCDGLRSHYKEHHFARLSDYVKGTIPEYKGKTKRKGSKSLWQ